MSTLLIDRHHPLRDRIERAMRAVFLAEYGAHLAHLPDTVIASLDRRGGTMAAAGLRFTADGLFSEAYLDRPAEILMARAFARPVERERIVEISNLAAPRPGAALPLVAAAIRHCRSLGIEFGLFTATARLRELLRRCGLAAADFGAARPERLPGASAWGSYYHHEPRVLAVAAAALPARLLPSAGPAGALQDA